MGATFLGKLWLFHVISRTPFWLNVASLRDLAWRGLNYLVLSARG